MDPIKYLENKSKVIVQQYGKKLTEYIGIPTKDRFDRGSFCVWVQNGIVYSLFPDIKIWRPIMAYDEKYPLNYGWFVYRKEK